MPCNSNHAQELQIASYKKKKKKKKHAEAHDIINLDIEKPTSVGKVYKELHH